MPCLYIYTHTCIHAVPTFYKYRRVSHAERAAIRTECRMLTKFIKMVDSFVQDSVVTLCRDRVNELLKIVTKPVNTANEIETAEQTQHKIKRGKGKKVRSKHIYFLMRCFFFICTDYFFFLV